jgi:hypothetical protein
MTCNRSSRSNSFNRCKVLQAVRPSFCVMLWVTEGKFGWSYEEN